MEIENRLHIRLIEHRVHATGIRHLELGVQVHIAVRRVDTAMQALTRMRILAARLNSDLIMFKQAGKADTMIAEHRRRVEAPAVQRD